MIDIIKYMSSIYNWKVDEIEIIPTRFNTNDNYQINHNGNLYFLKLYASKKAFTNEKWFLDALSHIECTPEIILDFEGDDTNRASIILPYYSTFKTLDIETIQSFNHIAFDIGKQLSKLHIGLGPIEYFGKINASKQFKNWKEYLKSRLLKIKMISDEHNNSIIEKVYCEIEDSFSSCIPDKVLPGFVHSDLNPDNILYDLETKKIMFIDFERGFLGDSVMDFPKLFWRCFKFDNNLISLFYDGYGIDPNPKTRKMYMNIFFIDLLSYLIKLPSPSKEDIETIHEITQILENEMYDGESII